MKRFYDIDEAVSFLNSLVIHETESTDVQQTIDYWKALINLWECHDTNKKRIGLFIGDEILYEANRAQSEYYLSEVKIGDTNKITIVDIFEKNS